MARPFTNTPAGLTGLIRRLSGLLDTAAQLGAPMTNLEGVVSDLQAELERRGIVEFSIDPSGALDVGGTIIEESPPLSLGRILSHAGVLSVVLTPGLEQLHLLKFVQTIAGLGLVGPAPESDLVTYWAEEGESTIRLAHTALLARHLLPSPPPELNEAITFEAAIRSGLALSATIPTLAPTELATLSVEQHAEIEAYVELMHRDSETSLRRQYVSSVLASLSCSQLALSPREYAAMLARVFSEQILASEWDDILKSLRNIEYMTIPDARVPNSTKTTAKEIVEKLLPNALTLRLARLMSSLNEPPPVRVLRTIIGNDPPNVFKTVAPQLNSDDLGALVKLFASCFAPEHPFWREGVAQLRPELQTMVRNTLATADTLWQPQSPSRATVAAPSRTEKTQISLLDFSLDDNEDEYPNELDESLLSFLDSAVRPKTGTSSLPSDMLKRLDELERSLAPEKSVDKP